MANTFERLSTNQVKLRLELSRELFTETVQKAYLKVRSRYNAPGFRRGKAPKAVLQRLYGEGIYYEDAFESAFPDLYEAAITEFDLSPVGRPQADIEEIGAEIGMVITCEVYVKPEITLGQYKDLPIAKEDDTVDPETVDAEIARMREQGARQTEITDRAIQDDDIVTLDYQGTIDGAPFPGGTAAGQELTVGSGQFIPGFEEQMVGMVIGEEKDLNVPFPADYHAEELAGKMAVFHVTVKGIRTKELPALDDEFAKDVSDFDTFAAYKQSITEKLQQEATTRCTNAFENALVEAAAENAGIDLPPPLIETEIDNQLNDLAMRMAYQGVRMQDYLQYTGQSGDELRAQYRESAIKRAKGILVLEAIAKQEGIVPSPADIDEITARYAKESGKDIEAMKETLTDAQKGYIEEDAKMVATLGFLKRHAKG